MELATALRRVLPVAFALALSVGCTAARPPRFARAYDLNLPGIRIGAFADCDSERISRKIFNKAEIVPIDDVERGCIMLLTERIDAFVYDEHLLRLISWRYPDRFRVMEPALDIEPAAIAVSDRRPDLRDELNAFIAEIRKSGLYDEMFLRWCHDPERKSEAADGMPAIPEAPPSAKVLRIGTDCDEEPSSYLTEQGEPTGFDLEFIRRFAASRGYRVELVIRPFTELLEEVSNGTLDCAVANLDRNPERPHTLWTDAYFDCDVVMLVKIPDEP